MSRLPLGVCLCACLSASLFTTLTATPASARVFATLLPPAQVTTIRVGKTATGFRPPAGYLGQNWTHPNGCAYARTGHAGREFWLLTRGVGYLRCNEILARNSIRRAY